MLGKQRSAHSGQPHQLALRMFACSEGTGQRPRADAVVQERVRLSAWGGLPVLDRSRLSTVCCTSIGASASGFKGFLQV